MAVSLQGACLETEGQSSAAWSRRLPLPLGGSFIVVQATLELEVFLPQPPSGCRDGHVPPGPTF